MTVASHTTLTDEELVATYCTGDATAFREIVTRHGPRMWCVARRYARNDHDAHDITQDALLRASQNLGRFRNECRLSTWLHRLVANSGYDHVHHRHRREIPVLDEEGSASRRAAAALSHDPMAQVDLSMLLATLLGRINPEQAIAMVLIDAIGHSVAHVAARQKVRPGTVKSRRSRARDRLRAELEGCLPEGN